MDHRLVGEIIAGTIVAVFGGLLALAGTYLMFRITRRDAAIDDDRAFRRDEDMRRLESIELKLDGVVEDVADLRERAAGIEGLLGYAFPTAVQGRRPR